LWVYHKDHTGYQTSIPPFRLQQKIAWCPVIVEWGNCINIHLKSSTNKNIKRLLTSNVNSSRFTRILTGSVMNLFVISSISWGRVAEIKTTYRIKTRLFKHYNILYFTTLIRLQKNPNNNDPQECSLSKMNTNHFSNLD